MTPLIAFYGDDFTGSTDALECLAAAGLRAVLFADVPSPDLLSQFEDLQAIGIAGNSRALTLEEMEGVIPKALGALRRTGAPICGRARRETGGYAARTHGGAGCAAVRARFVRRGMRPGRALEDARQGAR